MSDFSNLNILIIEASFYEDIAEHLRKGATARLKEVGASYDIVTVPGALEIPVALSMAVDSELLDYESVNGRYHGCVALGCVIRGETSHYDIVAQESARGLMNVATAAQIAVGNGILTVENKDQALARAKVSGKNKGASAVDACLALIQLKNEFDVEADDDEY